MDKRLREKEKKFEEVELLKSILGVSTFSALVIIAEIEDVNRFPDEKKISAICSEIWRSLLWAYNKAGIKISEILVECARIHDNGKHKNVAIIA